MLAGGLPCGVDHLGHHRHRAGISGVSVELVSDVGRGCVGGSWHGVGERRLEPDFRGGNLRMIK